MKKIVVILLALTIVHITSVNAQTENAAQKLLSVSNEKLSIGGYAQIDYNQPLQSGVKKNGTMDIHRMVLLFGYNFSDRTQFVTELEFEHVTEVYVEQAWLNHRITEGLNFRGGLMLIPMGLINEYHEPPTYNGVERPNVDKYIVPTTWREIGAGFNGRFPLQGIDYQLYIVNGFNGYDGSARLNGKNALRGGRQKGASSYISSPNISAKINLSAIPGLKVGLSGYLGNTQSKLLNGIDKNDTNATLKADSSIVGINMAGIDGVYMLKNFELRGQLVWSSLSNTEKYNAFTGSDLGSAIYGAYAEVAYTLALSSNSDYKLKPFVRLENYDTHFKVGKTIQKNDLYNRSEITTGFSFILSHGAVLKVDYQWLKNAASDKINGQLNAGIGIWF